MSKNHVVRGLLRCIGISQKDRNTYMRLKEAEIDRWIDKAGPYWPVFVVLVLLASLEPNQLISYYLDGNQPYFSSMT